MIAYHTCFFSDHMDDFLHDNLYLINKINYIKIDSLTVLDIDYTNGHWNLLHGKIVDIL